MSLAEQSNSIPKMEPFNQSRLSRLIKEPPFLKKAEQALSDRCMLLKGEEAYDCWEALADQDDLVAQKWYFLGVLPFLLYIPCCPIPASFSKLSLNPGYGARESESFKPLVAMSISAIAALLGVFLLVLFAVTCFATGLYYLAELVEEHCVSTGKLIRIAIKAEFAIHLLLFVVDGLPFFCIACGLLSLLRKLS